MNLYCILWTYCVHLVQQRHSEGQNFWSKVPFCFEVFSSGVQICSWACQEVVMGTETVPEATATATCQDTFSHSLLAARAARVSFEFVSFLTHYSYQFQSVSWFAIFLWIPGPWGAHTRLRAHSDCTRAALALRAGPAGQLRSWCSEVGCCWQNYPQASSGLKVRFQIVRWLFFVVKYAA